MFNNVIIFPEYKQVPHKNNGSYRQLEFDAKTPTEAGMCRGVGSQLVGFTIYVSDPSWTNPKFCILK